MGVVGNLLHCQGGPDLSGLRGKLTRTAAWTLAIRHPDTTVASRQL